MDTDSDDLPLVKPLIIDDESAIEPDETYDLHHMPLRMKTRKRCAFCRTNKKNTRTLFMCEACNLYLCILPKRHCFGTYHTELFSRNNDKKKIK